MPTQEDREALEAARDEAEEVAADIAMERQWEKSQTSECPPELSAMENYLRNKEPFKT